MPIMLIGPAALAAVSESIRSIRDSGFPAENIRHHFAGQDDDRGVYGKETLIPAGWSLLSHAHSYDHLSVLASGVGRVTVNGKTEVIVGPRMMVVSKGEPHEVYAITPVTWYCIHPTSETDPDKVDHVILTGGA